MEHESRLLCGVWCRFSGRFVESEHQFGNGDYDGARSHARADGLMSLAVGQSTPKGVCCICGRLRIDTAGGFHAVRQQGRDAAHSLPFQQHGMIDQDLGG